MSSSVTRVSVCLHSRARERMVLFLYLFGRRTSRCHIEILAVHPLASQPIGHRLLSFAFPDALLPLSFLYTFAPCTKRRSFYFYAFCFHHLVCSSSLKRFTERSWRRWGATIASLVARMPGQAVGSCSSWKDEFRWLASTKTKPRKQHKASLNSSSVMNVATMFRETHPQGKRFIAFVGTIKRRWIAKIRRIITLQV